jgi:hypothetical protein
VGRAAGGATSLLSSNHAGAEPPCLPINFAREGKLMKKMRSFRGPVRSSAAAASLSWRPPAASLLLPVVGAALLLASTLGCAGNPRLEQLHKGTSCSAENVQTYAVEHNLTYQQALAELRRQDQQLWTEQEARQKTQK